MGAQKLQKIFFFQFWVFLVWSLTFRCFMIYKREKWPYLDVLVGFNLNYYLCSVTCSWTEFRLKPTKTTKYGRFLRLCIIKRLNVSDLTKKTQNWKTKFFVIFGPPCHPPRGTHISASRAHIKNRLDESANLAQRGIHAKFQPNSTSRLARAMGGVRFLT